MRKTSSPARGSPRSESGDPNLSETLFVLSHSGIDTKSRQKFLNSFNLQICSRTSVEAVKHQPKLSRVELEGWIGALQQYTRYLNNLLLEQEEPTAEEQLQMLIDRAKNSPRSPTRTKTTQTTPTPKRSTQTTPQKRSQASSPLLKSQNSRQNRGISTLPVRQDAAISANASMQDDNENKSFLARLIESSPKYISFMDPDSDSYDNEQVDATTQTTYISPKKQPPSFVNVQNSYSITPVKNKSRSPHKHFIISQVDTATSPTKIQDDDEYEDDSSASDFVVEDVIPKKRRY